MEAAVASLQELLDGAEVTANASSLQVCALRAPHACCCAAVHVMLACPATPPDAPATS